MIIALDPARAHLHPDFDVSTLFDALDTEVKPYLERVDGVAEVNIYGGREREVQVLLDAVALAQRQLHHDDVIRALQRENRNVSAGSIAEGKRDYRIRLLGQFTETQQVLDTIVAYRAGKPVYVRDVARVQVDHTRRRGFVRASGSPSIAMNVIRQTDANVMAVMADLRGRLDEVRQDILPHLVPEVGGDLRLQQVYDETVYIDSAVHLVIQNLWFGGALAALVLLLFLRSLTSTAVIGLAIPISVIGTFLVLLALGRSLNVISLAGLAFAVGMVVDNAIVVLENIYRRMQGGEPPREAALTGGREVWGAILASTLTTVAVFVPVLTVQEEAGQLFRDISLAIVAAVALSLVVSITVIPAACSRWLRPRRRALTTETGGPAARAFGATATWLSRGWRGWTLRPLLILTLTALSVGVSVAMLPPLDYLPAGNRNLVFGALLIPPGYSVEQKVAIAERIEAQVLPYAKADLGDPASVAALPPIPRGPDLPPFDPVPVGSFFIVGFGGGMFTGALSQDQQVVIPVGTLLTNAMNTIPDAFGGARQASIFGRGVGGGNRVDLEISGPQLDRVVAAANVMFGTAAGLYGYGNVRPDPANFNLTQPEWTLRVNDLGRELGLSTADLAAAVRSLYDGAYAGDFTLDGTTVDLVLLPAAGRLVNKEAMADIPIATPTKDVVPLDAVVDIVPGQAPQEIQRIEELPSVTVQIVPPEGRPLQAMMDEIREQIVAPARAAGLLDATMRVRLEGTAAKLDEVRTALLGSAGERDGWRPPRYALWAAGVVLGLALLVAGLAVVRALRRRRGRLVYGGAGAIGLGLILAAVLLLFTTAPHLLNARFVWALIVTYLLMCALFESYVYPFVIMFSVPLAVVGGFVGLRIVHEASMADPTLAPQQLDVLTMLGFVILIGVVVNNAILIVHQALNVMREDETVDPVTAVGRSVRTRVRPIFMSTLTSVGGMLPLVLMPGAGSEMYRGLGSVVVGGLLCSTVFTLLLVPLCFTLVLQMQDGLRRALARP
jgi:HAE1 family hydrophobic/amphiphilic exporter-1